MSDYECQEDHVCSALCTASNVYQTLDELEFERGIWYAAQYGDIERVDKLLKQGVDVDIRDSAGYTALHYAARNGHLAVCQLLLQNHANINATTYSGNATPLHRACSTADCQMADADGKTALHRAAESQHKEICEALLSVCPELKTEPDHKNKLPYEYARTDDLKNLLK